MTAPARPGRPIAAHALAAVEESHFARLVWADQRDAVRRAVLTAIPVNMILGVLCLAIAIRYEQLVAGLVWFSASTAINLVRMALCGARPSWLHRAKDAVAARVRLDPDLRLSSGAALLSGLVWAVLPLLCDDPAGPQAVFYLVVICGITAGAVTHGTSFAAIPVCFIIPPLLSEAGLMLASGEIERWYLGVAILLYLAALTRSSLQTARAFRASSRLKYDAVVLADRVAEAHARSEQVASDMSYRAAHDPLTGLLNRSGFLQEIEGLATGRHGTACLMLLDLDGFKSINDLYGHAAGDRILIEVAIRLRAVLGYDHIVARFGGDEFAVFSAIDPPDASGTTLARRIIDAIAIPFGTLDARTLGVSIGIHQASEIRLEEMLTCADEALYAAKEAGRNGFYLFDDDLRHRQQMRRDIERDLARAIADGHVEVLFQPIFGQSGATLTYVEALLRWRHPRHGDVPPETVVAAAALSGLSSELFGFVLDAACAMLRALRSAGLYGVGVAMNVSPLEMSRLQVDDLVLTRLAGLGLPPTMLELEITEETAMDVTSVHTKLARLSGAGVRIAVDDFGVGSSSLASLRSLKVDRVKIDGCFVRGISDSPEDRALVQVILDLGRALRFEVVAEGVETADDLRTLQALGCSFMQGYHLGQPMPAGSVLRWLRPSEAAA